jgi:RNA polymerase sigma-70 factor (ECF subfamily)
MQERAAAREGRSTASVARFSPLDTLWFAGSGLGGVAAGAIGKQDAEVRTLLDFDAAYERHSAFVAGVALRILGREGDVDDVVQEVFLHAFRARGSLRDPQRIAGWLKTITVRTAHRRLRRRRVLRFLGLEPEQTDYGDVATFALTPEEGAVVARIYAALDDLPVGQRLAWTLRFVEGERLEQVAELCGCSLRTAKRWVNAANEAVRRKVDDG